MYNSIVEIKIFHRIGGSATMRERMTVEKLIEELNKCSPNAVIVAESPYRDQFYIYSATESDNNEVVWLEA